MSPDGRFRTPDCAAAYERNFMRIDLSRAPLAEGRVRRPMYLEKWSDHYQDAAAQLIAAAYTGHVDSRINDQYRSAGRGAAFPVQHRAVSRMRRVLPAGVVSPRSMPATGTAVRNLPGQHRRARMRAHHADLRVALRARNRHRPCAVAAIADHVEGDGLPVGEPDRHRGERRCGLAIQAGRVRDRAAVLGVRVGRLVVQ